MGCIKAARTRATRASALVLPAWDSSVSRNLTPSVLPLRESQCPTAWSRSASSLSSSSGLVLSMTSRSACENWLACSSARISVPSRKPETCGQARLLEEAALACRWPLRLAAASLGTHVR
jgi:hypothetical protein